MLSAFMFLLSFVLNQAHGQYAPVVTGSVYGQDNIPLEGVTVEAINSVGKSVTSTATDASGNFSFPGLPAGNFSFSFTSIGYDKQQLRGYNLKDGASTNINVNLALKAGALGEVVVTALGIVRKKETLGYATQRLDGSKLNEAPASNFVNNLGGKVAGVNIIASGSVGGSSRITIRGESSLSLSNNQPLFVIDGVPVGNDGINNTSGGADYGNSASEINPADVESVNVLKGPAAAALYGSRAFNGAIIITTKKGASRKGVGVSYNSYYFNEKVGRLPKFQNKFGQGNNGKYEGSNFGAGWSGYPNGIQDDYDESWGPRLDNNSLESQFDSPTSNGYRAADVALPNRGNIIPTPWISQPNNIKDFFVTGHKNYNNIAFSGGNESGNYRLSLSALNEKGVIPNNDLKRYNVGLNSSYKLSENFTSSINLNYVRQESDNRPDNGYGRNTFMYFFTWMGRNVNINSLKNYWTTGLEGIRQFQYNYGENHNNPFFLMNENTKGQQKDRLYGNISLDYAILPNLKVKLRTAQDYYNDFRPMHWAVSTIDYESGRYEETRIGYLERNTDILFTYNVIPKTDFGYTFSAGANRLDQSGNSQSTAAPALLVPGVYNLGNTSSPLTAGSSKYKKRINSVYGTANINYKDLVFLDVTGRNDWSSTLPVNNNSYFYPSFSVNNNIRKMLNLPAAFSRAEVRFSWAQVGNDAGAYSIYNTYGYGAPWGNNYSLVGPGTLLNANLKPEISSSYEVGTSLGFFNNRLGIDFSYYDIRAKNQIMGVPNVRSSGAFSRIINAGEIKNSGVEIILNTVPVNIPNSLRWNITLNLSHNVGKIISLTPEVDKIVQSAPGEDASIQARVGERMGAIYGPGYQRVADGQMKGEIIIFPDAYPRPTSEDIYLGNLNPDWIGGVYQNFSYKNFSLNVLFAGQLGGKFVSRFFNKAAGAGQLEESALGREARKPGEEYDAPYYIPGAADMGSGKYQPNNTSTDGTYSTGVYGTNARNFIKKPLDHISEAQMFSSTYVKLRELSFGYNLPGKLINRTFIKNAKISLTGRNLLLFTPSSNKHFDPEVAIATQGSGLIPGFENMATPSTREMGISLNFNF
jgi:TonB-linked SusC/RagA family outer membrane protein